jgi:DUF1680 family protein
LLLLTGTAGAAPDGTDKLAPVVPIRAESFPPQDVRLHAGPFLHAQELDHAYLLSLDPDRLLVSFRATAGLDTKGARAYGGWESPSTELRGHFVGHYLTACARMYAATGDERVNAKGDAVVAGLAECQKSLKSGYVSAFPESFLDRVDARQRVWAPWYTLHKVLAGLIDMNRYAGNAQALEVATGFGQWVNTRAAKLDDRRMEAMLGTEHGGINEAMANLAAITGDKTFLDTSLRFNHHAVLDPAIAGRDNLTGLHANTQVPKFIGNARQYELTGNADLRKAAQFFFDTVANERSYVIGGHSDGEMFSPKETLSRAFGPSTTETCNTYNMIKLAHHLYDYDPSAHYADYCERALFNHILASQDPEQGGMCYYVPLRPGSSKQYNSPENDFWCCTGTGVENHAIYGDDIYARSTDGTTLYWNQFIASSLEWPEKGLSLLQETRFPDEPTAALVFATKEPVTFALQVRRPFWATDGWKVLVNGEPVAIDTAPGHYATIEREWKTGDRVESITPFRLRTEGFADDPNRLALLDGPIVLGTEIDSSKPAPVIVSDDGSFLASLRPVVGKPLTFQAAGPFRRPGEATTSLVFEPFFRIHGGRNYTVYFDVITPGGWSERQAAYEAEQARERELEARTVDVVLPNNDQSERDHDLKEQRSNAGIHGGRLWRDAFGGGFFEYTVKVKKGEPQSLLVTYWGGDSGQRDFTILVDGHEVAHQVLNGREHPGVYFDATYPIPAELVKDRDRVTVRFASKPDHFAGGVFGLRVVGDAK